MVCGRLFWPVFLIKAPPCLADSFPPYRKFLKEENGGGPQKIV